MAGGGEAGWLQALVSPLPRAGAQLAKTLSAGTRRSVIRTPTEQVGFEVLAEEREQAK